MTKKEMERTTYINKSKKQRKEEAKKNRIDWIGLRPAFYKDKTKYNRQRDKKISNEE